MKRTWLARVHGAILALALLVSLLAPAVSNAHPVNQSACGSGFKGVGWTACKYGKWKVVTESMSGGAQKIIKKVRYRGGTDCSNPTIVSWHVMWIRIVRVSDGKVVVPKTSPSPARHNCNVDVATYGKAFNLTINRAHEVQIKYYWGSSNGSSDFSSEGHWTVGVNSGRCFVECEPPLPDACDFVGSEPDEHCIMDTWPLPELPDPDLPEEADTAAIDAFLKGIMPVGTDLPGEGTRFLGNLGDGSGCSAAIDPLEEGSPFGERATLGCDGARQALAIRVCIDKEIAGQWYERTCSSQVRPDTDSLTTEVEMNCDVGRWNYRARALFLATSIDGSALYTQALVTNPQLSEFCSDVV